MSLRDEQMRNQSLSSELQKMMLLQAEMTQNHQNLMGEVKKKLATSEAEIERMVQLQNALAQSRTAQVENEGRLRALTAQLAQKQVAST